MTNKPLSGAMTALATPLTAERKLDHAALERLITRSIDGGVSGISPSGSTGEGPQMSSAMRHEVVRHAVQLVAGRVPVIGGVVVSSLDDARAEVDALAALGVTHILATPPYYYPLPPEAVEAFFLALADHSQVPVILYHMPQMTKNPIPPDLVLRLSKHTNIVGLKDSGKDFEYLLAVLAAISSDAPFSVLQGVDTMLLPSLVMGACGAVAASANFAPELGAGICAAFADGRMDEALALQRRLTSLVLATRRGTFPAGWKAALSLRQLCEPFMVNPMPSLSAADMAALDEKLIQLNL